jgi:hypothetical protein
VAGQPGRFLLASAASVALLALAVGAVEPAPRIFAVLEEFERACARPLWPGFEPRKIPLEITDSGRTWLVRHPSAPPEFVAVDGRSDIRVFEGRHQTARANNAIEIDGVRVASASLEGHSEGSRPLAALLLHEAFHVFQAVRHPHWGGNEVDLFLYPVDDAPALAMRRLESAALSRALESVTPEKAASWAARALEIRRRRFERLPPTSAEYERASEKKEGLARYIEVESGGRWEPPLTAAEFDPAAVRDRAYASGCAIALLLDRLDSGWKDRLEKQDDQSLDGLLTRAVAGSPKAEFSASEEAEAARRAARDVAGLGVRRAALAREFLQAPGWKVVVEAGAPLFPQAFDPLNFERVSPTEILHTRWIKLGNAAGSLEVLDHRALTEAAGQHPLFNGVKRVTVTGLSEPRVEESDGKLTLSVQGLTLEMRGASLNRTEHTLTIKIP